MGCELAMHDNMVEITDNPFTPVGGYSWGLSSSSLPKTEIKNEVNTHMPDLIMNESSVLHLYLRPEHVTRAPTGTSLCITFDTKIQMSGKRLSRRGMGVLSPCAH